MRLDERLLGSTQPGSIGHGTREDTHEVGDAYVTHTIIYSHCHRNVQRNDEHSQPIKHHASFLKRGEEARSHLEADGENEQDESELLNELDNVRVHIESQVPGQDAHKQDESGSQRNPKDLLLTQYHAQCYHERIDEDGVRHATSHNQFFQPIHSVISKTGAKLRNN